MREEIDAAVVFLKRLMQKCNVMPSAKLEAFSDCLSTVLEDRFQNHWYKEKPDRGQGYRCITFSPVEPTDPILERAALKSGICLQEPLLPIEMTLWVDPNEVCCSIGEISKKRAASLVTAGYSEVTNNGVMTSQAKNTGTRATTIGARQRVGELRADYCMVATMKDGSLDNRANTLDIVDFIQSAKETYNKQLNITTTRVNSNNRNKTQEPRPWTPNLFNQTIFYDNHNHDVNGDTANNNNNKKFANQNNRGQFNNFNNRPYPTLDNGRPFIPPDFSIPPPPPPMGFKPWQPPGAYSPPAKNKNANNLFRNKGFNSFKNGPPPSHLPNGDRFHWQKDTQKVGS